MATEAKPFKLWFDEALARRLAADLASVEPSFKKALFIKHASKDLSDKEMMARVGQFADALHAALPSSTKDALQALVRSLPKVAPSTDGITGYGYMYWPYGEFIARYGLDDVDASFHAMVELTKRFSSEFAVRPFLAAHPHAMLDRLAPLVDDASEHVRRWVSEGTRTRLPWGKRVKEIEAKDLVEKRIALLTKLRHDESAYVRKSVANHLQDILKDDHARGFSVVKAWVKEKKPTTDGIAKHACRGLLKAGDKDALALFGHANVDITVEEFTVSKKRAKESDVVTLKATVRNDEKKTVNVRLDYVLESPGAKEKPVSKTFRFADVELAPRESATRTTTYKFVTRTIRALRAGRHQFTLRCNGESVGTAVVTLALD